jgi:hypothetical protein
MGDFYSWGGPMYSELRATPNGECVDIEYVNTVTVYPSMVVEKVLMDQSVTVKLGHDVVPDEFFVVPAAGWEVVTENHLMVEEWTSAIITVCQMLLG